MIMTLDLTSCLAISSMCDSLTSLRAQGALCIEKVQRTCRRRVRCPRLQVVTPCCSTKLYTQYNIQFNNLFTYIYIHISVRMDRAM